MVMNTMKGNYFEDSATDLPALSREWSLSRVQCRAFVSDLEDMDALAELCDEWPLHPQELYVAVEPAEDPLSSARRRERKTRRETMQAWRKEQGARGW
jgi:hypothetical protein